MAGRRKEVLQEKKDQAVQRLNDVVLLQETTLNELKMLSDRFLKQTQVKIDLLNDVTNYVTGREIALEISQAIHTFEFVFGDLTFQVEHSLFPTDDPPSTLENFVETQQEVYIVTDDSENDSAADILSNFEATLSRNREIDNMVKNKLELLSDSDEEMKVTLPTKLARRNRHSPPSEVIEELEDEMKVFLQIDSRVCSKQTSASNSSLVNSQSGSVNLQPKETSIAETSICKTRRVNRRIPSNMDHFGIYI